MDDPERDKFYSSTSDDAAEGDEYELEPLDPEVLAGEQRRAQETMETTRMSVDIDEIYREAERDRGREILESWARHLPRRFQIKHLLLATAVLAILLTLARLNLLGMLVVAIMLSVAGVYLYLQWQEKKQQDEVAQRRHEMYARRRAQLGQTAATDEVAAGEGSIKPFEPPITSEIDEIWQQARTRREFQFKFSMQQLMIAVTAAAIIFGLVHVLGGASNAATLLGLVALFGLLIHAVGVEPPEVVVLGWWLVLVLYVLLSVAGVLWRGVS
ncbi:MAG: hypothetical protein WD738_05710 [Pirellulales bacterium]